jgi:hypothetical protein
LGVANGGCYAADLCGAFGVDCGWVQRADLEVVGGGGVLGRAAEWQGGKVAGRWHCGRWQSSVNCKQWAGGQVADEGRGSPERNCSRKFSYPSTESPEES